MVSLRQIRSLVAVFEEGSFTRAAKREHATQSGVSQHVAAVEKALGVTLFEREPEGVRPTPAGRRYYAHAVQVLRHLDQGAGEARSASTGVSGPVRAGLMPAFTRAALAPVLDRFLVDYPQIDLQIIEGYSGTLTEMVRAQELDFALVPAGPPEVGLKVTHLVRDREMLVSGSEAGLPHQRPVNLSILGPLDMIVPTRRNIRRARLEAYFETHDVPIRRFLEMDAMMGTLELVARGTWVAVLPGLICVGDWPGLTRHVAPIDGPPLHSDFVMIEPSRQPLSPQAARFYGAMKAEVERLATE